MYVPHQRYKAHLSSQVQPNNKAPLEINEKTILKFLNTLKLFDNSDCLISIHSFLQNSFLHSFAKNRVRNHKPYGI